MVDKQPPADSGAGVNFDTGEKACNLRISACQPIEFMLPEPMGNAVCPESVHAGIDGEYFKTGARSWVTLQSSTDILCHQLEEIQTLPFGLGLLDLRWQFYRISVFH